MSEEENNEEIEENEGNEEGEEQNEKLKELEEKAQKAEELEEKLKEAEEALAKEQEKDKNFDKFRKKEKGKRSKLGQEVDELKEAMKKDRENTQKLQDSILEDAKTAAIKQLAGDDKDLKAKLEERVKESVSYLGAPKNTEDLMKRYEKAYEFLEGTQKRVNPLNAFHPVTGQQVQPTNKKNYMETKEGDANYKEWFKDSAKLEKKK